MQIRLSSKIDEEEDDLTLKTSKSIVLEDDDLENESN